MPGGNLSQAAMQDIDPDEDDVGEDFEPFAGGARGAASSWGGTAKSVGKGGFTVAQQGLGRLGNVAQVANLSSGGSFFSGGALISTGTSATAAALAPVVAVTGPIGIALACVDSAFSGVSAYKTHGHIRELELLLNTMGSDSTVQPGTKEAILFAVKKKNKKLKRKGIGCVPILGSICNTVYTVGRTAYKRAKGTKGVERRQHASALWGNTLVGDRLAIAACKELLGVKVYEMIKGLGDGHLVLKKKMKSL